jgi:diguanylate cyclase (GGDEF)-like protein
VITLGIGDLDDFKRINDRHGHLAGDACLTSVAETLTEHSRATDQVFRWGGDEFAVLLPGAPGEAAATVLERLEAAVAERVRDPDGAAVRITFGSACSEGVGDCDLRTLTERADAALLRRKPARSR